MVASRRGRGAKAQPAKAAAEPVQAEATEENFAEDITAEAVAAQNAGEQPESEEPMEAEGSEDAKEGGEGESAANANGDSKPEEEKKEDPVEPGKILVENLPISHLFEYQEKLKELFSQYGEVTNVRRGPMIITDLTTSPTLSAIVEFKNKDSLEKAVSENGTVIDGATISVAVESRAETAVLVGVPYEATIDYVRLLFAECGEIAQVHEFRKTQYKILRVTFSEKESVERALKLDRELRINGFLVTVNKYRDEDEQKTNIFTKNRRQNPPTPNRNNNAGGGGGGGGATPGNAAQRNNNNNARPARPQPFPPRPNFRGGRGGGGRGGFGRGGAFPRGGFAPPLNNYMPPAFMPRPQGGFMDGQRPNKRLRQM